MPISASERIRRALTLLEKQYGRLLQTKAGDPLDQLIYQVLLAGVSRKEADGALRRLREQDGNNIVLRGMQPSVRRVFEITGLTDLFTIE